jgi:hypothetical protein
MMTFDIHKLDGLELDDFEQVLEEYQDDLLELFFKSPEGQAHLEKYPEAGFWSGQLMYYGYGYLGVTLPQMTKRNVEEVVTELFPRKISLFSPEDADDAIPELMAFWKYLKREYNLRQANTVLRFLQEVASSFGSMMNDPSKFGMAKSFMMMGQTAGFDMTDEKDIVAFMHYYNANLAAQGNISIPLKISGDSIGKETKRKRKRKHKAVKAARKRSKKR